MKTARQYLPLALVAVLIGAAFWHGPIAQLPDYHAFADRQTRYGIPRVQPRVRPGRPVGRVHSAAGQRSHRTC